MSKIQVFPAEIDAGLGEAIASDTSLAFLSQLRGPVASGGAIHYDKDAVAEALAAHLGERPERDTYDLYPVRTIMVSTGWNGNDDIFSKEEVWAARHSPEDKPFNLQHKPRNIIGHITSNVAVDESLATIADNTPVTDLPDKFHVVTSAVIYRHVGAKNRDPHLAEEAAEIIAGIENGDWYVSMECLFDGFDYGFRDPSTGRLEKVVARQESTAFLTKHLRAYKGSGQYNGYTLGRVLRNINFVGKGLVEVPANPESEFIFNDVETFAGQLATPEETKMFISASIEEETTAMAEDTRIRELESQLAEARKRIEELGEAQVQAKLDTLNAEVESRNETIASLESKIEELTKAKDEAVAAKTEADEALKTKTEEHEATVAELDGIKAEATKVTRVSTLVDKGMDKEKAEETVAKFEGLDDEKFAAVADLIKVETETESSEATQESSETEEESADDESQASQDEEVLENAEEETEPNMAAASEEDEKGEAQAALSSFVGTLLSKGRKS